MWTFTVRISHTLHFTFSLSHVSILLRISHTLKAPLILSHSWFLQIRALTHKYSWLEYHTLRFDYFKKTHIIKLSLRMSHIIFLPIQISHTKYVVLRTQAIWLTSPLTQHHHIVQAIPISPSPPSPASASSCGVYLFVQQSWVLWLNFWQILQKYLTLLFRFFFADSSMWSMTLLMRWFFFGRPFLLAADHDGQKRMSSSGFDIACTDFIEISVLQYRFSGYWARQWAVVYQYGMIPILVNPSKDLTNTTICWQGMPSLAGFPQVQVPNLEPSLSSLGNLTV